MDVETQMDSLDGKPKQAASPPREVRMGEAQCPRCHKFFTASYWSGESMVQARCLSCDLKWPLPDVV
jgi:NMD protein affecting ribosome stability and mRNA decay